MVQSEQINMKTNSMYLSQEGKMPRFYLLLILRAYNVLEIRHGANALRHASLGLSVWSLIHLLFLTVEDKGYTVHSPPDGALTEFQTE